MDTDTQSEALRSVVTTFTKHEELREYLTRRRLLLPGEDAVDAAIRLLTPPTAYEEAYRASERLADFLMRRYPHRLLCPMETAADVAIRLLTPGDGSDLAWERLRLLSGLGDEARARVGALVDAALAIVP